MICNKLCKKWNYQILVVWKITVYLLNITRFYRQWDIFFIGNSIINQFEFDSFNFAQVEQRNTHNKKKPYLISPFFSPLHCSSQALLIIRQTHQFFTVQSTTAKVTVIRIGSIINGIFVHIHRNLNWLVFSFPNCDSIYLLCHYY